MFENGTYIVTPTSNHTHTVILLHGRDSTAMEFGPEFFESKLQTTGLFQRYFPATRLDSLARLLPQQLILNTRFDTEISQWFDLYSLWNPEMREEEQIEGLKESVAFLLDVINIEASHVPLEKIILGGISQGCATAIIALLSTGLQLGFFLGICSWLPFQAHAESSKNATQDVLGQFRPNSIAVSSLEIELQHSPPVFITHSQDDGVVLIQNGRMLYQTLERLGMNVTWKEYESGGHWVNEPKGVADAVAFLQSVAR